MWLVTVFIFEVCLVTFTTWNEENKHSEEAEIGTGSFHTSPCVQNKMGG